MFYVYNDVRYCLYRTTNKDRADAFVARVNATSGSSLVVTTTKVVKRNAIKFGGVLSYTDPIEEA